MREPRDRRGGVVAQLRSAEAGVIDPEPCVANEERARQGGERDLENCQ
jgi:hypothetical protein